MRQPPHRRADQVQQPGQVPKQDAMECCNAGPVCCNGWSGSAAFPTREKGIVRGAHRGRECSLVEAWQGQQTLHERFAALCLLWDIETVRLILQVIVNVFDEGPA